MCCKVHVLQSVCVAKCMCCKVHVLQSAFVANCMCCKVDILQSACIAKCIVFNEKVGPYPQNIGKMSLLTPHLAIDKITLPKTKDDLGTLGLTPFIGKGLI